eukprot:354973-Chlamydomonas_euryale.AAC.6
MRTTASPVHTSNLETRVTNSGPAGGPRSAAQQTATLPAAARAGMHPPPRHVKEGFWFCPMYRLAQALGAGRRVHSRSHQTTPSTHAGPGASTSASH